MSLLKIALPTSTAIASPIKINPIHLGSAKKLMSCVVEILASKKNTTLTTNALLVACAIIDSHKDPV